MSRKELPNNQNVPTISNLPPLIVQDTPVISTDALAIIYDVNPKQIRDNYNRNKTRFTPGKHCFKLQGNELRRLKHETAKSGSVFQIPNNTNTLLLWTERGAARHAKMLETDKAWEVFEKLEDNYFDALSKKSNPVNNKPSQHLTPSTSADRQPIRDVVSAWCTTFNIRYDQGYKMVRAAFGLNSIDEIPKEWVQDAVNWVQNKIDMGISNRVLPPTTQKELEMECQASMNRLGDLCNKIYSAERCMDKEAMEITTKRLLEMWSIEFDWFRDLKIAMGDYPIHRLIGDLK